MLLNKWKMSRRIREDDHGEIRMKKRSRVIPPKPMDSRQPFIPFIELPRYMTLLELKDGVSSDNTAAQLEATIQFKKILSQGLRYTPYDAVVSAGVVPRFVEFLERNDEPLLQLEAAWILTNIASGKSEHTQLLVDLGVVPLFVHLLSFSTKEIRHQAVWALGNIAGDSPSFRDIVLDHGALLPLLSHLNLLDPISELSLVRNAAWTLSNFCRGKPPVEFEQIKPALSILQQLIYFPDEDVVAESCWALSFLTVGSIENIQAVIGLGVCPQLVQLVDYKFPSDAVVLPAIRTLGNIVAGNETQAQLIIDKQVLPCLYKLLFQKENNIILKEVTWMISNITAGNTTQIQAVHEANLIFPLLWHLQFAQFDVREEIARTILNVTSAASDEQIKYLVDNGCIEGLCNLLISTDSEIVKVVLDGLNKILLVGEADKEKGLNNGVNTFAEMINDCGGWGVIGILQTDDEPEIREKAKTMVEKFWYKGSEWLAMNDFIQDLSVALNRPPGF